MEHLIGFAAFKELRTREQTLRYFNVIRRYLYIEKVVCKLSKLNRQSTFYESLTAIWGGGGVFNTAMVL